MTRCVWLWGLLGNDGGIHSFKLGFYKGIASFGSTLSLLGIFLLCLLIEKSNTVGTKMEGTTRECVRRVLVAKET